MYQVRQCNGHGNLRVDWITDNVIETRSKLFTAHTRQGKDKNMMLEAIIQFSLTDPFVCDSGLVEELSAIKQN